MSKPIKDGIDYFPLDVDMDETEEKMFIIEAECEGVTGFGILVKLLMRIYKSGYYLIWNERVAKIFSQRKNLDLDKLVKIVEVCVREGFFDKELYEKYGILTSHGIQKRYFKIAGRRTSVDCIGEYLLINIYDYIKEENVNIVPAGANNNRVNVNNNSENADKNPENVNCKHDVNIYPENVDNYPTRKERKERKKGKKGEKEAGEMSTSCPQASSEASAQSSPQPRPSDSEDEKLPPEEASKLFNDMRSAIGSKHENPRDGPSEKSRDEQRRELAAKLKETNPEAYEKLIEEHPELEEVPW